MSPGPPGVGLPNPAAALCLDNRLGPLVCLVSLPPHLWGGTPGQAPPLSLPPTGLSGWGGVLASLWPPALPCRGQLLEGRAVLPPQQPRPGGGVPPVAGRRAARISLQPRLSGGGWPAAPLPGQGGGRHQVRPGRAGALPSWGVRGGGLRPPAAIRGGAGPVRGLWGGRVLLRGPQIHVAPR